MKQEQLKQPVKLGSKSTDIDTLLEGYRLCAQTEGKSPKTFEIARTAITSLRDFFLANGMSDDVIRIGPTEIRAYISHLQQVKAYEVHPFSGPLDRGVTVHTINTYMRSIRAFWSWLVREEFILSSPFDKVRIPKPPQKITPTFTGNQLESILRSIDTSTGNGFRDLTIILILLDSGIRASELVNLTTTDVNLDDGIITVFGKGYKYRAVPIGSKVQRTIWKYLLRHRPEPANPLCSNLFLSGSGYPLTVNTLEAIVERRCMKAGIEGVRCSPHTFRHTCAISYLRNGGDVFALQRILGHETLDMVRSYVNVAMYDLQAMHQRYSPVDNLKLTSGNRTSPLHKSHTNTERVYSGGWDSRGRH
jgi:integrase/recombinase XerD